MLKTRHINGDRKEIGGFPGWGTKDRWRTWFLFVVVNVLKFTTL
jgi:hypothetical protein